MENKTKNPEKFELQKKYQELHGEYQQLAAQYGDSMLKIRYWTEKQQELQKLIDALGDRQKDLEQKLLETPDEIDDASGDGAADQTQASAANG